MSADGQTFTVERIVAGGFGLARTPDGVVLIRGALPGEVVTARSRLRNGVLHAHVIDILEPHPHRVDLPLPPGADLPLAYAAQLPVKTGLVRDALERIGKLDLDLAPVAPSPRELGYRTAAQYATAERGLAAKAAGSNRPIAVRADLLAAEPVNAALDALAGRSLHGVDEVAFRASLREGRVLVGLLGGNAKTAQHHARALAAARAVAGVVWAEHDARGRFRGRTQLLHGTDRLLEDYGGVAATVTVQSFAQVNPLAAGALYVEAAQRAGSGARAVEAYAGSGVLGLHLAAAYREVVAIDIAADAVRRGEADARRLGVANVRFHRGDARTLRRCLPADLVVVDPPRAGLGADVAAVLASADGPPRIVYVSCDPATWARDAALLTAAGYRATFARPYDFYPYTHHVEVLSVFER